MHLPLLLGVTITLRGRRWLHVRIQLANGKCIVFCIELLFGAVLLGAPTPLKPNTKLQIGDYLTGDHHHHHHHHYHRHHLQVMLSTSAYATLGATSGVPEPLTVGCCTGRLEQL